jgi:hypothetical protein
LMARSRAGLTLGLVLAAFFVAGLAFGAKPKDAQAQKAIKEAVEKDFLETRFDAAETTLRGAIAKCGQDGCTPSVKAKLLAALGSVLAAGKRQLGDARDTFVEALLIDKAITPNPDIASPEADFAFEQAKKQLGKGGGKAPADSPPTSTPKPKPKPSKVEDDGKGEGAACKHDEDCSGNLACQDGTCALVPDAPGGKKKPEADKPPEEDKDAKGEVEKKNWFSIEFVPDLAIFAGSNVCSQSGQAQDHFFCLRSDKTHYRGTPTLNNGDNVTLGLAPATMRVVLGFERIVANNVGLGARVGFAFNGATDGGASFLPVHLEGRVGYYLGRKPFVGRGVRPEVFLAAGVAQVDSHIDVQVLEDGNACGAANPGSTSSPCTKPAKGDSQKEQRTQTLTAYKQGGPGFAGGGIMIAIAPVDSFEFIVGGRASVTFPSVVTVISPEVGFALGF